MKTRLIAFLLIITLLLAALCPACAENTALSCTEALLETLLHGEWERTGTEDLQQWIDEALAPDAGSGSEWFALGLAQLQTGFLSCDLSPWRQALESRMDTGAVLSASTRQKQALCLLAVGGDTEAAASATETIGQQGIMSWIFGLHLLNNGCEGSLTAAAAAEQLCAMQLEDGGWALMGTAPDPDVTAMALQALAPHRQHAAVEAAVQQALEVLAAKQLEDGGFASMGAPNPESAAQVLIALCALGMDPMQEERFIKNGHTLQDSFTAYALPEGGYAHAQGGAYSASATAQVFLALAAHYRLLTGQSGLYLLDGAWQPAMPQAPSGAETAGNGQAMSIGIIGGADGPTAILVTGIPGWKLAAALGIAVAALVWCLTGLLRGRRNRKHWLPPLLVAVLLIFLLLCTDIQTPESYYGSADLPAGEPVGTVYLEIRCDTLPAGTENVPADGTILPQTGCPFWQGDTVYDLLTRAARQHRLQLDVSGAPGMIYVSGLQYLYEQANGELSGWMFFVNGESASRSCDQYILKDGDSVLWAYTCQMGEDLP